jgi:hypothetical protein
MENNLETITDLLNQLAGFGEKDSSQCCCEDSSKHIT